MTEANPWFKTSLVAEEKPRDLGISDWCNVCCIHCLVASLVHASCEVDNCRILEGRVIAVSV